MTELVRGDELDEGDEILYQLPHPDGGFEPTWVPVTGQVAVDVRIFGAHDLFTRKVK